MAVWVWPPSSTLLTYPRIAWKQVGCVGGGGGGGASLGLVWASEVMQSGSGDGVASGRVNTRARGFHTVMAKVIIFGSLSKSKMACDILINNHNIGTLRESWCVYADFQIPYTRGKSAWPLRHQTPLLRTTPSRDGNLLRFGI